MFRGHTYDLLILYQHAWNASKSLQTLLQKKAALWRQLTDHLNHISRAHYLVVMGDLNTTLAHDPPFVASADPRRPGANYADNSILQQLLRDQGLIALTCKSGYSHTFCHGTHASRIDNIFVRQHQIQYRRIQPHTDTQVARNFGQLGPHHHPVFVILPKWYDNRSSPHPMHQIDREVVRHACMSQIPS